MISGKLVLKNSPSHTVKFEIENEIAENLLILAELEVKKFDCILIEASNRQFPNEVFISTNFDYVNIDGEKFDLVNIEGVETNRIVKVGEQISLTVKKRVYENESVGEDGGLNDDFD